MTKQTTLVSVTSLSFHYDIIFMSISAKQPKLIYFVLFNIHSTVRKGIKCHDVTLKQLLTGTFYCLFHLFPKAANSPFVFSAFFNSQLSSVRDVVGLFYGFECAFDVCFILVLSLVV